METSQVTPLSTEDDVNIEKDGNPLNILITEVVSLNSMALNDNKCVLKGTKIKYGKRSGNALGKTQEIKSSMSREVFTTLSDTGKYYQSQKKKFTILSDSPNLYEIPANVVLPTAITLSSSSESSVSRTSSVRNSVFRSKVTKNEQSTIPTENIQFHLTRTKPIILEERNKSLPCKLATVLPSQTFSKPTGVSTLNVNHIPGSVPSTIGVSISATNPSSVGKIRTNDNSRISSYPSIPILYSPSAPLNSHPSKISNECVRPTVVSSLSSKEITTNQSSFKTPSIILTSRGPDVSHFPSSLSTSTITNTSSSNTFPSYSITTSHKLDTSNISNLSAKCKKSDTLTGTSKKSHSMVIGLPSSKMVALCQPGISVTSKFLYNQNNFTVSPTSTTSTSYTSMGLQVPSSTPVTNYSNHVAHGVAPTKCSVKKYKNTGNNTVPVECNSIGVNTDLVFLHRIAACRENITQNITANNMGFSERTMKDDVCPIIPFPMVTIKEKPDSPTSSATDTTDSLQSVSHASDICHTGLSKDDQTDSTNRSSGSRKTVFGASIDSSTPLKRKRLGSISVDCSTEKNRKVNSSAERNELSAETSTHTELQAAIAAGDDANPLTEDEIEFAKKKMVQLLKQTLLSPNSPELRFQNMKIVAPGWLLCTCQNATSLEWLLSLEPMSATGGRLLIVVRASELPWPSKIWFSVDSIEINTDVMLSLLQQQNTKLKVNKWISVSHKIEESTRSAFTFLVDPESKRALGEYNWDMCYEFTIIRVHPMD